MAKPVLTFDEETHVYTLDGKRVPSVTEIVGVLTAKDMGKLSPYMLDNAARRGTRVHELTQLIDYGVPLEDLEIEPDIAGYIKAYLDFLRDYRPEWLMIEQQVSSCWLDYAGTLDRYGIIDGKDTIVDIKTTAGSSRLTKIAWATQTAGYGLSDCIRGADSRLIVQLKPTGKYTVHDCGKDEKRYDIDGKSIFLSCLRLTKIIGGYE